MDTVIPRGGTAMVGREGLLRYHCYRPIQITENFKMFSLFPFGQAVVHAVVAYGITSIHNNGMIGVALVTHLSNVKMEGGWEMRKRRTIDLRFSSARAGDGLAIHHVPYITPLSCPPNMGVCRLNHHQR